jgi:hypothetical protein
VYRLSVHSSMNTMECGNEAQRSEGALDRERTIPTERPPFVGEVSANLCGHRMSRGQRDGSLWPYSRISIPKLLPYLPSSSSIVLKKL